MNKDILLHVHSITIEVRKLPVIHHYCLIFRLRSSFVSCPSSVLWSKDLIMYFMCVSFLSHLFHIKLVPWLFFDFMTLLLLKNTGQLCCRMSLNVGFSIVSSRLDSGYKSLAGMWQKQVQFLLHSIKFISLLITSVTWLGRVKPVFSILKLLTFLLQLISILWRDTLRLCNSHYSSDFQCTHLY